MIYETDLNGRDERVDGKKGLKRSWSERTESGMILEKHSNGNRIFNGLGYSLRVGNRVREPSYTIKVDTIWNCERSEQKSL